MRELWSCISPISYYHKFRSPESNGAGKNVLLVYANYDLTFPLEYSLQVVEAFRRDNIRFEPRILPCGHYTTGETPYKYIDGWYLGSFVYRAFKELREEKASGRAAGVESSRAAEEEAVTR